MAIGQNEARKVKTFSVTVVDPFIYDREKKQNVVKTDNYKIRNWFIMTGERLRQGKRNVPEHLWSKSWPENYVRVEADNPPRREVHNRTQSTPEDANMSSGVDGSPTVAPGTSESEGSSDE